MSPEDELVDCLDKVFVQFLALLILLRPVVCVRLGVNAVDVFMVLDKGFDCVGCKLVGDLISKYHVNMNDVSLQVYQLVVENSLDQRVGIFPKLGFRSLWEHKRGQCPDGIWRRQCLGQTSLMLRYTVERSLDPVDTLECLCQPRLNLGTQHDVN